MTVRPPFPFSVLLEYLARRCTPSLDRVTENAYERQTSDGPLRVTYDETRNALCIERDGREPTPAEVARVEALFQYHRSWVVPHSWHGDPILGPRVARVPGFRPLGYWEPLELCLRTVIGQQVSVAAAGTLMARLGERAGGWSAERIACANLEGLGMPGARVRTLRALAERAACGDLPWQATWPELREALASVPGLGPWTLDYLGIRLGRDLDAFPVSDLGLIRAVGVSTPKELATYAVRWAPLRGWAASYLWMP